MATSSTTSTKPTESAKETLSGMIDSLEQRFDVTPRNDLNTTLNTKWNILPARVPTKAKKVGYFCIGIGGRSNDGGNLSSAQPVLGTNMAPYTPIPFRAVPLVNDLTAPERANYALRVVKSYNNVPYALYYAKKIELSQDKVQLLRTDPVSQTTTEYQLDPTNLSPTPPVGGSNGVISDIADSVSVVVPATATITGLEVYEAVNVLFGGDPRYAVVSEIGFISASAETATAQDANGTNFNYLELIAAQMVDHYTWIGMPFVSTQDSWSRSLQFSLRNLITAS